MGTLNYFGISIGVMIIYSLFITFMIYSIPAADLDFVLLEFKSTPAFVSSSVIGEKFQSGLQQQQSFGVVEVAALALYSGNLIMDLLLNFFTAIPSMVSLGVKSILYFVNIPAYFKTEILSWVYSLVAALWVLQILTLLIDIRRGSPGGLV